jgi:sulfate transport system ATP-binding protein
VNVLSMDDAAGPLATVVARGLLADSDGSGGPPSIYVRPHDLDLTYARNGAPAWPCRVVRVIPLGGLVRLDVALTDGTDVRVELSRERYSELDPRIGESLYLSPRELKVFHEQAQPA